MNLQIKPKYKLKSNLKLNNFWNIILEKDRSFSGISHTPQKRKTKKRKLCTYIMHMFWKNNYVSV